MYNFSIPLLYYKQAINELIYINKKLEKSKIKSLYFSLPSTCELFTGFEQTRNQLLSETKFDYWQDLMIFAIENNFEIIYCLNSMRYLQIDNPNFPVQIEKLHTLLNELLKIGVTKLRISSPKLMTYINNYFPQFEILVSTSTDYKIIQEFQFLKQIHPYIKEVIPSHNVNKNFTLLKNIKKIIEIEIMVNEGCIQGCSNRIEHACTITDNNLNIQTKEKCFQESYCKSYCTKIERQNPFLCLSKGNHIYPWEIEEYGKIGVNKFKINGRDGIKDNLSTQFFIENIKTYLYGIEDIKNILDEPVINFLSNSVNKDFLCNLTVKDIKNFLPDIKYFFKHGENCASICAVECKYCYKCAEKIKKVFEKKQKENSKQPHYVPACKISS